MTPSLLPKPVCGCSLNIAGSQTHPRNNCLLLLLFFCQHPQLLVYFQGFCLLLNIIGSLLAPNPCSELRTVAHPAYLEPERLEKECFLVLAVTRFRPVQGAFDLGHSLSAFPVYLA